MKLNHLKIAQRLGLAFGAVVLVTLLVAILGLHRLTTLGDAFSEQMNMHQKREAFAREWSSAIELNYARTRSLLHSGNAAFNADVQNEMKATSAQVSETLKAIDAMVTEPALRAQLEDVARKREAYTVRRGELIKAKLAGQDVAEAAERELHPLAQLYLKSLANAVDAMKQSSAQAVDATLAMAAAARAWIVAAGLLAALLGCVLAWSVARSITRPLRDAVRAAEAITAGDLTTRVATEGRDETAALLRALSTMSETLSNLVDDVRRNADSVASASGQIASGNNELSARTEQQASALEQTAASMEELNSTVRQNADNAQQANQLAMRASGVAVDGGEVVGRVVETMKGINDSSRQIADIIGVIDGIAFQTNILALNAAVEAARAGEQGRGFAVVASEVRSLAQRSADAAKEIKTLIGASVERVEQGTSLVDQAGRTMADVVEAVRRVTDIMGEISAASQEQSEGVAQVGQAVTQMDQATQQNAALVEESAAAADVLRSKADQLVRAVAVFRIGAGARRAAEAAPARVAPAAAAARPAARAKPSIASKLGSKLGAKASTARAARPSAAAPTAPVVPAGAALAASCAAGGEWESF